MEANEFIEQSNLSELVVWSLVEGRLLLLGSDDLSYYHQLEIAFDGVTYLDAPTSFWSPRFRRATDEEARRLRSRIDVEGNVYAIEDRRGDEVAVHFVVAAGMSVEIGMVYHYQRDDLKPGERVAPWVLPTRACP